MKNLFIPLRTRLPILGLASCLMLAGGALPAQSAKDKINPVDLNVPMDQTAVPRDGLPRGSFAPIVEKVTPAVVKIEITATNRNARMEDFGGLFPPHPGGPQIEHGVGSGVIITRNGYILT